MKLFVVPYVNYALFEVNLFCYLNTIIYLLSNELAYPDGLIVQDEER